MHSMIKTNLNFKNNLKLLYAYEMNWYSVTCMRNKSVFFILGHFYLAFKMLWDSYIQTFPAEELSLEVYAPL